MSLRTRLILIADLLVIASLIVFGAITYLGVRNFLYDAVDQSTREVPLKLDGAGEAGPGDGRGRTRASAYVEIRLADGSIEQHDAELADGTTVALQVELPDSLVGSSNRPDGPARFQTVASDHGPFRVKVSRDATGEVLIIGVPFGEQLATLRRLLWIEMFVVIGASLVATLIGALMIRAGLRPIAAIEDSARRNALNDAILAIRKPLDAMVTRRAKRTPAAVTAYNCRVLSMIGTIHYLLSSCDTSVVPLIGSCLIASTAEFGLPFHASALC